VTNLEAVKYGFLTRLAEEGVAPGPETEQRIAAAQALLKRGNILGTVGKALTYGAALPIGLAATAGIGAGHMAAKLQEPAVDLDEASNDELIDAYNEQARRARLRRLLSDHRPPPKKHYAYGK
jgi:hypothetical protein